MSRNVVQVMNEIFDDLKSYVLDEDISRISKNNRHIKAEGDEALVIDFVKRSKMEMFKRSGISICLFEYDSIRYMLIPSSCENAMIEIGLFADNNLAVTQGAGMLAIAKGCLSLDKGITSLLIIERCLGVIPDPGKTDVVYQFADISSLFEQYAIFKMDDSIFELFYEEDIDRMLCYFVANSNRFFSDAAKKRLKDLAILRSSRSISGSILNSFRSSLIEYTFLQLYQCLEYLFILDKCFIIVEENGIKPDVAINIVTKHEFKISELDSLCGVIKRHAKEPAIDGLIAAIPGEIDPQDKYFCASRFIYKLRCNIAHLRYNQEEVNSVDWKKCIEAVVDILYGIFEKLDNNIVEVCKYNGAWKPINGGTYS